MTRFDSIPPKLLDLAMAFCDERLTPHERDGFEEELLSHPAAVELLYDLLQLEAELQLTEYASRATRVSLASIGDIPTQRQSGSQIVRAAFRSVAAWPAELASLVVASFHRLFSRSRSVAHFEVVERSVTMRWMHALAIRPVVASILAAGLFVGVGLLILSLWRVPLSQLYTSTTTTTGAPSGIAQLRTVGAVEWGDTQSTWRDGKLLAAGDSVHLERGFVRVDFFSGVSVLLEGPAEFVVSGDRHSRLLNGKLTALVAPEGRGFVVALLEGRVVDLGTEFGLKVENKQSEVHVLQGSVRLEAEGPQRPLLLRAGEAARLVHDTKAASPRQERIAFSGDSFVRLDEIRNPRPEAYVDAVLASRPLAYYRFSSNTGNRVHDYSGNRLHAVAEDRVKAGIAGPRGDGFSGLSPLNCAADFDGGRIIANLPLDDRYTVEMWVFNRTPNSQRPVAGYLFSRSPSTRQDSAGDHLFITGGASRVSGLLSLYAGLRMTSLRNEAAGNEFPVQKWQHVVLVRDKDDVSIFLNGQMEVSGIMPLTMPPQVQRCYFGGRNDRFSNLSGMLDEISVYGRALSAKEVRAHFYAAQAPVSLNSSHRNEGVE